MSSTLDNFGGEAEEKANEPIEEAKEVTGESMGSQNSDDNDNASGGLVSWASIGGERFVATGTTRDKLRAGVYQLYSTERGIVFQRQNMVNDDLISTNNSEMDKVLKEVESFWGLEENFRHYGFLQKRGILLWGRQGCGKSAIVQLIAESVVKNDGIVLLCNCNPELTEGALNVFREVENKRNLVCVFEDIEAIIETKAKENKLLSILDGEVQVDKVLNIATTNYPQKLDPRIVGRPRRFDRLIEIQPPDENMRRQFFKKKLNMSDDQLDVWVERTEGMSFASLSEAVISVCCLGNDFDETINRLNDLENEFETGGAKMGFSGKK